MARFKTRARALDMLGRQQIAGIPTAINELFKNAYDAYADRVEVDYFRFNSLVLLRDDGLGMTESDFLDRWLALGTESKLGEGAGLNPPPVDPDKPRRPILGEKGIGRLAAASIGAQLLILSRAMRRDGLHDLVAAFIHWGMFAIPGIDLDQIEIPVRVFRAGSLPSAAEIASMVSAVKANLADLNKRKLVADETVRRIMDDLSSFELSPERYDGYLRGPALRNSGHGTHFYILPTSDLLALEIDPPTGDSARSAETASPLLKALLGFTNTMVGPNGKAADTMIEDADEPRRSACEDFDRHSYPTIETSFRDHKDVETYEDLITAGGFWLPEDFADADHEICGSFDEYGRFQGTVRIYDESRDNHIIPWPSGRGRNTFCGPFSVKLAYVQGDKKDSKLDPETWTRMTGKLDKISGLYVYKNGIRILPYGNNDVDWLDIERRRTQNIGYYFFSYRRMFGYVGITHEGNPSLIEKAGREGFQENKAYRDLRNVLVHFFVQLAAEFFRGRGEYGDLFLSRREELNRQDVARREHERRTRAARRTFRDRLDAAFDRIQGDNPKQQVDQLLEDVRSELARLKKESVSLTATRLMQLEMSALDRLQSVADYYEISRPIGLGLTVAMERRWEAYLLEQQRLHKKLFEPARSDLSRLFEASSHELDVSEIARPDLEQQLSASVDSVVVRLSAAADEPNQAVVDLEHSVSLLTEDAHQAMTHLLATTLDREASTPTSSQTVAIGQFRQDLEQLAKSYERGFAGLAEQIRRVRWFRSEEGAIVTTADLAEAIEDELLALRERSETDMDLTQLGMAIEVVSHEFNNTVNQIRHNLRRLKAWSDVNPDLASLYTELRTAFEHLDGYLTLFTPLNRRLYRSPIEITGEQIEEFLHNLFKERLQKADIKLSATEPFLRNKIIGYPSVFYPVFINLVDNAMFWLQDQKKPRSITLDFDGSAFVISDTGPGVSPRDVTSLFEPGFSRKPGGRGLGLFISRSVLNRAGYQLLLDNPEQGKGAVFRIMPK